MPKFWTLLFPAALLAACGLADSSAGVAAVSQVSKSKEEAPEVSPERSRGSEALDVREKRSWKEDEASDDAQASLSREASGGSQEAGAVGEQAAGGEIPPLYFFYVIHGHASGENLPYTDQGQRSLDENKAQNFVQVIDQLSGTADKYGVKITWELASGTAKGIREYQGADNIFKDLLSRGHEVGIHTHDASRISSTIEQVNQSLGILVKTGSGLLTQTFRGGSVNAQQVMSDGIRTMVEAGVNNATINLTGDGRSSLPQLCNYTFGEGNDMGDRTGNLLFPYKPDYKNNNVCRHDPDGNFVFVDHIDPTWMLSGGRPGPLTDSSFNVLRDRLDAALNYMEERRPAPVAAWGFVTHFSEYSQNNQGGEVVGSSVQALDEFLAYVDQKQREGRIRYATVTEIADKVR